VADACGANAYQNIVLANGWNGDFASLQRLADIDKLHGSHGFSPH
jgi:hypothetical protein